MADIIQWTEIKDGKELSRDMIWLVLCKGKQSTEPVMAIKESYNEGVTDEFIKPVAIVKEDGTPVGTIKQGDVVICFNFRTDRLRQITTALTQKEFPEYDMHTIPLYYITMTKYDESFKNIHIIFDKEDLHNTLGEVLSKAGKKQLRIAETEKYAHVTFFFSGGREDVFQGEERILIPSPKIPTYDLKPSMSAFEVKDAVVQELNKNKFDFICLNFANGDMVGHTGIYSAITEAVESVDRCVKEVTEAAVANGYSVMIISDHGNADYAVNPDGSPNTAHSLNPVPCFLIDKEYIKIREGKLCDVAPTILTIMGMKIPNEMTGEILV